MQGLTICHALHYTIIRDPVIQKRKTSPVFRTGDASKLNAAQLDRIVRILALLDDATLPEDMNIPGLNFHGLSGKAKGRYAVRLTGNWRITFGWRGQDAIEVDMEDYH